MNKNLKFKIMIIGSLLLLMFLSFPTFGQQNIKSVNLSDSVEMKFVAIPNGTFQMGYFDGKARTVTITKSFQIGRTEITQAQWKAIMGDDPSLFKGDNLPVEKVSWNDVQEFINKLNTKGIGKFRLPTEAEWELAARAGTSTIYSFGDDAKLLGDYGWFKDNSADTTHEVGSKKPNPWGLYDMHGNVSEWVSDWSGQYAAGNETDPQGLTKGTDRVNRGGNYAFSANGLRSAYRDHFEPDYQTQQVGFRLVMDSVAVESVKTVESSLQDATTNLKKETQVPLRIPTYITPNGNTKNFFANVKTSTVTKYVLNFENTSDCGGKTTCVWGSITGEKLAKNPKTPKGIKVSLVKGIKGYFDSSGSITWDENGFRYTITGKTKVRNEFVKMANSAINNKL